MLTLFISILAGLAGVWALFKLWAIARLRRLLATPEGRRWVQTQVNLGEIVMPAPHLPWIVVLAIVTTWFVTLLAAP